MSYKGRVSCRKQLTGKCGVEAVIDEGGSYTSSIVIENGTSEAKRFCVGDQLPILGASMTYTSAVSGDAEGNTAEGEGPIEDTVVLQPYSTLTYNVEVTTITGCPGTSTNVASIWFEGEKAPKWVSANPVIVGCPELKAYPDDMTGRRPYQHDMVMHGLFGVGNNDRGQILMDLCESGFWIGDLFTNAGILKLLENSGVKSPNEEEAEEEAEEDE